MLRLTSSIRGYAWGSRDVIAKVQGRPVPSPGPEAELWIGAHPGNPSVVPGAGPLDQLISAAPDQLLGAAAVAQFGPRLPYLMKLLAAQRPLSVQTHPDSAQAAAGYAAEEAAGVPLDSPRRSYVDPYHKPELLVAVTEFEALCGFRPPDEARAVLAALELPGLDVTAGLSELVRILLTWPSGERAALVAAAAAADPLAAQLAQWYPADPGVAVALLLNRLRLSPGDALWMPAGNPHAYLHGAGIEIMAASDNVLRGGLTPKHVNVAELLRILRFEPGPPALRPAEPMGNGVATWSVPVPDFRLSRIDPQGCELSLEPTGPRTLFCLSGEITVADDAGAVTLRGGESAFGAATGGKLTLSGAGELYLATL